MSHLASVFNWRFSIFAATLLYGQNCCANPVTLVTEDYPPFNFRHSGDQPITGISTDIVEEIMRRSHADFNVTIYPWTRAVALAAHNPDTCVYSTLRTAEREGDYKWIGPLTGDTLTLFARTDRDIALKSISDVHQYRVGTYLGSGANEFLQAHGIRVDMAPDDSLNLKKMQANHIDLWVGNLRTGLYKAKRAGIAVKPVFSLGNPADFEMWLACSKNMPDQTVGLFNDTLKKMRGDGTIDRILGKYD